MEPLYETDNTIRYCVALESFEELEELSNRQDTEIKEVSQLGPTTQSWIKGKDYFLVIWEEKKNGSSI